MPTRSAANAYKGLYRKRSYKTQFLDRRGGPWIGESSVFVSATPEFYRGDFVRLLKLGMSLKTSAKLMSYTVYPPSSRTIYTPPREY